MRRNTSTSCGSRLPLVYSLSHSTAKKITHHQRSRAWERGAKNWKNMEIDTRGCAQEHRGAKLNCDEKYTPSMALLGNCIYFFFFSYDARCWEVYRERLWIRRGWSARASCKMWWKLKTLTSFVALNKINVFLGRLPSESVRVKRQKICAFTHNFFLLLVFVGESNCLHF